VAVCLGNAEGGAASLADHAAGGVLMDKVREHVIFWNSLVCMSMGFYMVLGQTGFANGAGAVSALLSFLTLIL
jgi:hypothetical protein